LAIPKFKSKQVLNNYNNKEALLQNLLFLMRIVVLKIRNYFFGAGEAGVVIKKKKMVFLLHYDLDTIAIISVFFFLI
jgi:hypothetical protein